MTTLIRRAVIIGALILGACIRCPIGTTRCDGNAAIACLSNGTWQRYLDCDAVSSQSNDSDWVCCDVQSTETGDHVAACVHASECQ